jgi:hypothetical protein
MTCLLAKHKAREKGAGVLFFLWPFYLHLLRWEA